MKKLIAFAALTAAVIQSPVHAQALDSLLSDVDFTWGGYGTVGAVRSSTDQAQFIRGTESRGANEALTVDTDSNLGLQATARFSSWLSATAQVLYDSDLTTSTVNWAYVNVEPVSNLSLRAGRLEMPLFAISDSRDINYANIWLRPPNEVYAMAGVEELQGGEATYTLPVGPTRLVLTVYGGNSLFAESSGNEYHSWDVHGGEVRWASDWVTLRYGLMTTENEVSPVVHDKYTFEGFGLLVDHNNVIAQAEFAKRYDTLYHFAADSNGWYVMGGYRFGKVAPYISYADTTKSKPYYAVYALSQDQSTTAIGVRWDAFKTADLKFQLDRVDPRGTAGISFVNIQPGFGNHDVTVASVTLDFVFGG